MEVSNDEVKEIIKLCVFSYFYILFIHWLRHIQIILLVTSVSLMKCSTVVAESVIVIFRNRPWTRSILSKVKLVVAYTNYNL